jgi:hypothetical protein
VVTEHLDLLLIYIDEPDDLPSRVYSVEPIPHNFIPITPHCVEAEYSAVSSNESKPTASEGSELAGAEASLGFM